MTAAIAMVDPALSGVAEVWTKPYSGTVWTKLSVTMTTTITDGSGSIVLYPQGFVSYRIVFRGATSNANPFVPK